MPAAHCAHGFWPQNHGKRKKASRNYVAGWITKQASTKQAKHWETLFKYASKISNAFSCANMMPAVAICVPFSCHNLTRICSHLQSIERATDCHVMSMSLAENLTISWKIFSWACGDPGSRVSGGVGQSIFVCQHEGNLDCHDSEWLYIHLWKCMALLKHSRVTKLLPPHEDHDPCDNVIRCYTMTHALPTNRHNSDLVRSRFWNHLLCLSISLNDLWFARWLLHDMTTKSQEVCPVKSSVGTWFSVARAGQECYNSIMTSLCYMDLYGDFSAVSAIAMAFGWFPGFETHPKAPILFL